MATKNKSDEKNQEYIEENYDFVFLLLVPFRGHGGHRDPSKRRYMLRLFSFLYCPPKMQ